MCFCIFPREGGISQVFPGWYVFLRISVKAPTAESGRSVSRRIREYFNMMEVFISFLRAGISLFHPAVSSVPVITVPNT